MADFPPAAQILNGVQRDDFPDESTRKQVLNAARALVTRLETPIEMVIHMSHEIPALNAALRVALDQGVFEKLDREPSTPKSPEQLTTNANPSLLNRFLKHLATMNIIKLAGTNLYLPTHHSSSLVSPTVHADIDYFRDATSRAFVSLPSFLSDNNYADPTSLLPKTNWQHLLGRDESHFEWLANNPKIMQNFGNFMAGYTSQRGSWLDIFPARTLLENTKADGPLIVDVGGGMGQDLVKYLQVVPESSGRLILQDLPQVIKDATRSVPPGIITEGHDFFTAQPVKGARAYFLHSVLHDWSDEKGKEILENIKGAMLAGYSRVILNEMVISSSNPTAYGTTLDMTMLALFSARERTEEDWNALLLSAGFKIVKIWQGLAAAEAIIEAELA